jgi:hypothetical protein
MLEYNGTQWVPTTVSAGSGTVTSVGVTVPSRQTVSGSPVTSSGTLAITDNTQAASTVFAGPASGSAAAPTFRAMVPADLPVATTSALGAVKPDGTTITVSGGIISSAGGVTYPYSNVYAVGTGTGMYTSIQAAITAINGGTAPTESSQAVVLIYPGQYTMTAAITVPQWVSIVAVAENFPVLLINNTTDVFVCSGYNQFVGLTVLQGTAANTWAFNVGNTTDVNVLRCAMYSPGSSVGQGFISANGAAWVRISARGCTVNSGMTNNNGNTNYIVSLTNTSTNVRFCDSWFEECFFDSYSLTNYGGGFNFINVQDVRVERSTIRGAATYNTSIRCTRVAGITGTPQVEVRNCYCAGGTAIYNDASTTINVLNTDAAGSVFAGASTLHNSYTGAAYNALGNI